jgi:hypothetical protein
MEIARLEEERAANILQPHQQRVVDEKEANDKKLEALNNFIEYNSTFYSHFITEGERDRLKRQRVVMTELSQILGERIAAFGKTEEQTHV